MKPLITFKKHLAIIALLAAPIAHAEGFFLGGGTNVNTTGFLDHGHKLFIGYKPEGKHYSFELARLDYGDTNTFELFSSEGYRVDAYTLTAAYNFNKRKGFNAFIKAGGYYARTKSNTSNNKESDTGLTTGVGLEYRFDSLGFRLELENLSNVTFENESSSEGSVGFSLMYQF